MNVFETPPPHIGYWIMPGSHPAWATKFCVYVKPNLLHRVAMRYLLGWKWEPL
jgi:hypothetical protein